MIARYVLHLEFHPHHLLRYTPRLSLRRVPRPGDRTVDGGIPGTLVRCPECGDGLLHAPDHGFLTQPRPTGGDPAPAGENDQALARARRGRR